MKKNLLIVLLASFFIYTKPAKAQFDYVGGGVVLTTGSDYKHDGLLYYNKSFGIDARVNYDYSKKLKIVPDFKFYLPNRESYPSGGESKTTAFVLNINAHYIINSKTRDKYRLYLIAGAHFGGWNIKDNHYSTTLNKQYDFTVFKFVPGANVGAGMVFPYDSNIMFFAEVKYVVAQTNQLVFTPGLLFVL